MSVNDKNIELLAPAGNMTALHAAVCGGANAVYLGLDHFNARRGADNFTLENLATAVEYAHLRGVKIYLTFNIIVFEKEFKQAISYARQAAEAGIDAFIVQDIGMCLALSEFVLPEFPNVAIHASTQMNIHSVLGLRHVARLGVSRVTLSREMSLDEIENICREGSRLGVDIEVFGHGAICISYSGQCMMSSMIGGRSANRGTCAQACRLNYELQGGPWSVGFKRCGEDDKRGNYLLSPKDLCSIDLLDKLYEAGVASLKIEGRMKSAEYVFSVVSIYRKALDFYTVTNKSKNPDVQNNQFNPKIAKNNLSKVFSRGFSPAYFVGCRDNSMMSYQRPNNRGVNIGRVGGVNKNSVALDLRQVIKVGDVLEVWTSKGRSVLKIDSRWKISGKSATAKLDMSTKELMHIRRGDRVFMVRDSATAFDDNDLEPRVKINGQVILKVGMPLTLQVYAVDRPEFVVEKTGDVVEVARTKAISHQDVVEHVGRTGTTPFHFDNLEVELGENAGIGFSKLHHLRASALEELKKTLLDNFYAEGTNE